LNLYKKRLVFETTGISDSDTLARSDTGVYSFFSHEHDAQPGDTAFNVI